MLRIVTWNLRVEFAAETNGYTGAIAQLGERLHGMQEVGGSIPPGSTNHNDHLQQVYQSQCLRVPLSVPRVATSPFP